MFLASKMTVKAEGYRVMGFAGSAWSVPICVARSEYRY
jgi:hypothetical protein